MAHVEEPDLEPEWYRMNEACLGIPGMWSCICYPLPSVKRRQMFRMALSLKVEFQVRFCFSPSLNGFLFVSVVCSERPSCWTRGQIFD